MSWVNLSALWKIVVFGLIAGAGLPALFAGGLYTLSWGPRTGKLATAGADGGEESDALVGGNVLGMVLAAIAFLIVLAAIGWGIYEVYQIGHPAVKK
jgi:TRAP-type uncharacterized transport system fused permease subunit